MYTLGVVDYLNALPLYRTLETAGTARFIRAVPSLLTPRLAAGECDAALIPIVDHLRGVGTQVISDACIGSSGAVRSVLMFHRVPVEQIQSVAVDTSSHSSVALLRVILADGYGIHPPFVEQQPDLRAMLESHEAALLIGDKALEATQAVDGEIHILDLATAWLEKVAHKPFVFAAWVARDGLSPEACEELGALLSAARDEGLQNLPEVVRQNPVKTRLTPPQIEDYLRHAIEFHMTDAHRAGLEEFRQRCQAHHLLESAQSPLNP